MQLHRIGFCTTFALFLALAPGSAQAQPQPVPPMSVRSLDHASYVDLAKQWQAYVEAHGETADALVNLGMAYDYAGERAPAMAAARRAVALAPESARPLAFLGKMLTVYADNPDTAIAVLEHCRLVDPDYGYGLTMLAGAYLRKGALDNADAVFKIVHERQVISRPLQDYAYNMLVGLPSRSVLVTAGDNDTFAPLALQAGMKLRQDVIVLNVSLLNVPAYAEAEFQRHPEIRPRVDIASHVVQMVDGKPSLLSIALLEALVDEDRAPVYFAVSVDEDYHGFRRPDRIEGINMRATGEGLPAEAAARLFLDKYRLDSATDWNQPWSLAPNEKKLICNYVPAMIKTAELKGVKTETRRALLDRAEAIARFHELRPWLEKLEQMRGR
jgi:tetratricopeptide (TPR) repeat protein